MGATTESGLPVFERRSGDTAFAAVCLILSLFLFSQMWSQTVWQPGRQFAGQPGFWPRLAVTGMVLCAGFNLYQSLMDSRKAERFTGVGEEVFLWARCLEFALWFMAYVFATPVIGYLAASIVFAGSLAFRVGYRSRAALGMALAVGMATVILFKALLQVKIPGGSVYEWFPDAMRNFFILYL
ncbi:tripartite tricarboxylate transporter TctB family protein [Ruegeria sp.]|uniref:tripartite tricarboxylate transporter TctB family protein n=1 Tax=Ruegeria sp. TaxID=1879320 RepID=UPI002309A1C6|nr:tripartite tricarboxylate transporter TctB family protein [Ruegeria sp.]MDA7967105.1 tripartite tricarboxylate transporter TctB family protein [Ruegeria sp.]